MSNNDIRAALERLIQAEGDLVVPYDECGPAWHELIAAARAALEAAPEGEPSDEELRDLWSWSSGQDQGPWPTQYHCFARAVLSRWGRPAHAIPPAPLEGEVGELVEWLQSMRELAGEHNPEEQRRYDRAAALLEQLAAAAQAVLDAVVLYPPAIAAALRAVADQVVPEAAEAVGNQHDEARRDQWLRIRWKLLALAAELEGCDA